MGYRAHVVTQHREYGSTAFSDWQQFDNYYYKLNELYPDDEIFKSESQDFYEISRATAEKEIERLVKLGVDKPFEFQDGWDMSPETTNQDVVIAWRVALEESPKDSFYVTLEWY